MSKRVSAEDVEGNFVSAEVWEALADSDDDELDELAFEMQNGKVVALNPAKPNTQAQQTTLKAAQPRSAAGFDSKVLQKIHVEGFDTDGGAAGGGGGGTGSAKMNKQVIHDLQEAVEKGASSGKAKTHGHDRSERATVESVLDPRTRLILYKLVNTGLLSEINGCVSTGKEAHVYYAKRNNGQSDAAVKVYNTSVLVFKDRERYVSGEFRFQRFCKSNPRKMVKTWAEKEARNLARLQNGGILVPEVILLRQHVLVMEFLGENGWPSPKLKDVKFDDPALLEDCYIDLISMMRRMYRTCRLVHGDLSEYNLLYHDKRIVMIDVSQSVEHDHPESLPFLRRDVVNVTRFFRARGLAHCILSLPQLFYFVTAESEDTEGCDPNSPSLGDPNLVPKLNKLSKTSSMEDDVSLALKFLKKCDTARILSQEDESQEAYAQAEARFLEVQHKKALREEDAIRENNARAAAGDGSEDDEEDGEEEEDEEDEETEGSPNEGASSSASSPKKGGGPTLAEMTKEEKKEHQRRVKEEKRLKRTTDKVPKHKKKRACAQHKKK